MTSKQQIKGKMIYQYAEYVPFFRLFLPLVALAKKDVAVQFWSKFTQGQNKVTCRMTGKNNA